MHHWDSYLLGPPWWRYPKWWTIGGRWCWLNVNLRIHSPWPPLSPSLGHIENVLITLPKGENLAHFDPKIGQVPPLSHLGWCLKKFVRSSLLYCLQEWRGCGPYYASTQRILQRKKTKVSWDLIAIVWCGGMILCGLIWFGLTHPTKFMCKEKINLSSVCCYDLV